jgi:enoyl-CoA hydratase/carnithine racemase
VFTDEILVEKLGPVTTIGINRPQKRNCLNMAAANKLSRAIVEFEEDDSALVGVLHGIGGNFCAGYDLEELSGFDVNVGLNNEAGHGPMVSLCTANMYFVFGLKIITLCPLVIDVFTVSPGMGFCCCAMVEVSSL